MADTGVSDTQARVQIPVNYCSLEDLLAVGATPDQARDLLGLREEYGSLTPELFEASDVSGGVGNLADRLNFWLRASVIQPSTPCRSTAPDHEEEFHTRSEAATFCSSTPKAEATLEEEPPMQRSPYPYDVYPPPAPEIAG